MTAVAVKNETGRIAPRDLRSALSLAAASGARLVELRPDCTLRFGGEDTAAIVPFPGRPWKGEPVWIDRVPFARVVRACGSDMLVAADGAAVTIESDSLTVGLAARSAPDLPSQDGDDLVDKLTVDALDLARLLVAVLPFSSTDLTRPLLCQVALDLKRGKVVATDSYRLAILDAPTVQVGDSEETLLLPRAACGPLATALKLAGGKVRISRSDGTLALEFGGQRWFIREVQGRFPDWEALLPEEDRFATAFSLAAGDLQATSSLIADIAMRNTPLRLKIDGDGATVASTCPDHAEVKQRLAATVERVDVGGVEIGFNPEYTRDIAAAIAPEHAHIKVIAPLRPALFTAPDAEYLLMPIRLNV